MQINSKNIQNLVKDSSVIDAIEKGYYKDIFSFPLEMFDYNVRPVAYNLTENDVYRFDLLMLTYYGQVDYYLDMILWINKIPYLTDDCINQKIYLPTKQDLDLFYKTYFVDAVV
jgi:hypothetical protein